MVDKKDTSYSVKQIGELADLLYFIYSIQKELNTIDTDITIRKSGDSAVITLHKHHLQKICKRFNLDNSTEKISVDKAVELFKKYYPEKTLFNFRSESNNMTFLVFCFKELEK